MSTNYYDKLRIIVQSNESGSREEVYFTEDLASEVDVFTVPGLTIDSDEIIDGAELPTGFPIESTLVRE